MKFYLAHPFNSRLEMRIWELEMERLLGVEIVNPFYDVERPDKDVINAPDVTLDSQSTRKERYGLSDKDVEILVERDLKLIRECDGVIVIVDGSLSYGTIQEMVYAKLEGKLVYSIISNGHTGHPWLRYHSTKIFTDLGEFKAFMGEKEQ